MMADVKVKGRRSAKKTSGQHGVASGVPEGNAWADVGAAVRQSLAAQVQQLRSLHFEGLLRRMLRKDDFVVLRVVNEWGQMLENSPWFGTDEELRRHGEILAAGYGVELQWYGPSPVAAAMDTLREAEAMKDCLDDGFRQLALF